MGFTIEDMLIFSKDKYEMEMVAGANGWANSISWLLMVEDTTIIENFRGKELVVTTGFGFEEESKQLDLIKKLDEHHSAGLIINTGFYIKDISKKVLEAADRVDLPLLTVPWDVEMSEMIKDLTVRIFLQTQTDEQISASFIKAIESPELLNEYREELSSSFDVDGRFQVVLFTTADLDSMDTMERKRVGYRLQIFLENISHNGHFFYYNGCFVLILNAVDDASKEFIIEGFRERAQRRLPDTKIYVGEGSAVTDVSLLALSYKRARFAVETAFFEKIPYVRFDTMGLYRIMYSMTDELILKEMTEDVLRPLAEYDEKHNADLEQTLMFYIKYNGSVSKVSQEMFIHKNTILYRMGKIKELLNNDLEDEEYRIYLYLACKLRNKKL